MKQLESGKSEWLHCHSFESFPVSYQINYTSIHPVHFPGKSHEVEITF